MRDVRLAGAAALRAVRFGGEIERIAHHVLIEVHAGTVEVLEERSEYGAIGFLRLQMLPFRLPSAVSSPAPPVPPNPVPANRPWRHETPSPLSVRGRAPRCDCPIESRSPAAGETLAPP